MCGNRNAQTKPGVKQNSLSDVIVCIVDVDDRHKVDCVAVQRNVWSVQIQHVLQILLNVINLHVCINNTTDTGVHEPFITSCTTLVS